MSTETRSRSTVGRATGLVRRTGVAIRGAFGRRDGKAVFALVTLVYFALYEYGLRHLGPRTGGGGTVETFVVPDPLATATRRVAPFQYEPVAVVAVGPVEYLFAPLTAAVGIGVATLVGVTMAVSWVAWRGPSACRLGPGTGAVAGVPGLLSGVVCCGPTVLLVLGIQASAGLLAVMQWFLPIAVLFLVGTLLWVGSRVESA